MRLPSALTVTSFFGKAVPLTPVVCGIFLICVSVLCTACARKPKEESYIAPVSPPYVAQNTKSNWVQKDLLITYSCSAPPTEKMMQTASDQSFNMIPAWEETLAFAQKHNMKVMLEHGRLTPTIANDQQKLDELGQVIDRVKNNPALECYYLFDEPKASDFPALAKMVDVIRGRDPNHFCFINMLPMHAILGYAVPNKPGADPCQAYKQFLNEYIKQVKPDVLSYDYYEFLQEQTGKPKDLGFYFLNLSIVRDAARAAKIPFVNIIQSCTFDKTFRLPTANELRWQVYTTLAYGGRGISYFLYWGPKKFGGVYRDGEVCNDLLQPIVQLNKELKQLSATMMQLTSAEVFNTQPMPTLSAPIPELSPVKILTPGPYVLGLFSSAKSTRADHFMLVNTNYKEASTAQVKVQGKTLSQFDRATGEWRSIARNEAGVADIHIEPGDGALFRFNE